MSYYLKLSKQALLGIVLSVPTFSAACVYGDDADDQSRRDRIVVEALMRLDDVDVNADPKLAGAVRRYLSQIQNEPSQLKIIQKLKVTGLGDHLVEMATQWGASTQSVQALDLAIEQGSLPGVKKLLTTKEPDERAIALSKVLSLSNRKEVLETLIALIQDDNVAKSIKVDAAVGLSRSKAMHPVLVRLAKAEKLPDDAKNLIGAAIRNSEDATIKKVAAELFPLLKTSQSPLPSIEELVKRKGNAGEGKKLYQGVATCSQCHMVGNEGKNVGPSLTEIGSKLSKDAMYVSILAPSAGISHSFEAYAARTSDDEVITGLLVSDTAEGVTIKDAKGIERTIARGDLEQLKKQDKSLMPENLQETMSEQGLVDLIEYLTTLKKP
jgi:putative heme-binding domain-containing protein